MNKKKKLFLLDGGAPLNAQYAAYYAAIPDKPSAAIKTAQNQLFLDLGPTLLARFKWLNFLHAGSAETAKYNAINPATYLWTAPAGNPDFSEGNGCKSNLTTYFNTTFKITEYAGIETDLTVGQYVSESSTSASGALATHGVHGTGSASILLNIPIIAAAGGSLNFSVSTLAYTNANHKGHYMQTQDATTQYMYKDGVKTTFVSTPIVPLGTRTRFVLAVNNAGTAGSFYTKYLAIDYGLNRISDADELAIRTALNTYKTTVGIP